MFRFIIKLKLLNYYIKYLEARYLERDEEKAYRYLECYYRLANETKMYEGIGKEI